MTTATKPGDAVNRMLCWRSRNAETVEERLEARNELVLQNQGIVYAQADRLYVSHCVPFADLVSEGQFGLLRAIDCFSLEMKVPFAAYATIKVRQNILDYCRENRSVIRVPRIHKGRQESKELVRARKRATSVGRITRTVPHRELSSVSEEKREEARRKVGRMLDALTERQRQFLSAYYGLEPAGGMTVGEMARHLGVPWKRAHKTRHDAEKKLRALFAGKAVPA